MKTLVIFYSFGGTTRRLAQKLAEERGADLFEVEDVKKPSVPGAFLKCPAAVRQKPGKVKPITASLADYDTLLVAGPVWASHPAPPVNNIFDAVPAGKTIEIYMVSSGGESEKAKVVARAEKTGGTVAKYTDVKADTL